MIESVVGALDHDLLFLQTPSHPKRSSESSPLGSAMRELHGRAAMTQTWRETELLVKPAHMGSRAHSG